MFSNITYKIIIHIFVLVFSIIFDVFCKREFIAHIVYYSHYNVKMYSKQLTNGIVFIMITYLNIYFTICNKLIIQ